MSTNIYNEKVYLSKNEEALKHFESSRIERQNRFSEESILYKDLLKEYKKFIKILASLLQNMNLLTSIEYSVAIKYLIDKGYLSTNLEFKQIEPLNELQSNYGLNIITGEGICRNYTDFHKDIMEELNQYVKRFYCVEGSPMFKAKKQKANHVLNLIIYEEALYGIDLFNANKLYKFKDEFTLSEISYDSNIKLRYKPYYEMLNESKNIKDLFNTLKIFKEESKKNHIKPLLYYDVILKDLLSYLPKEKDMYMDFHSTTKALKKNISDELFKKINH